MNPLFSKLWKRLLLSLGFDFLVLLTAYALLPNTRLLTEGIALERKLSTGKTFRFHVGTKNREYVPIHQIPKNLQRSIVALEDSRFYQHEGFDFEEIFNAIETKIKKGRRLRGASTISQQLVKNLYLSPERTFFRKFIEALITIKLELQLSKPQILEVYLNSIDWGKGLFGVAQASWHYFKKRPSQLNLRECVFLAAIVPNPSRFGVLEDDSVPKRFVRKRMTRALQALYRNGLIEMDDYHEALFGPWGFDP